MPEVICGCEVVKSLHGSGSGHAYVARRPGDKGGARLLVKTPAQHEGWDAEQSRRAANDFLASVNAQQEAAAASPHWAPVHEVDPSQPAVVSDYYERSAEWLISRRVELSSADVHNIADSVLAGLEAIEAACSRPHGNLKPSNVLLTGKGRIARAKVVLCDPAPPRTLRPEAGRALDLHAVGRMLFELITREDYNELDDYPVPPNRFDGRMEPKAARQWVSVCNELLARELTADAARLEEARRRVRKLKPPAKWPKIGAVVGGLAAVVLIGFLAVRAMLPKTPPRPEVAPKEFVAKWQELCDEHAAWFDDFAYEFHGPWIEGARQAVKPSEQKLAALLAQFPADWAVIDQEKPGRIIGGNQRAEAVRDQSQVAYKTQGIDHRLDAALARVRAVRDAVTHLEARRDAKALADALPQDSRLAMTLGALARELPELKPEAGGSAAGAAGPVGSGDGRGKAVKDLILRRQQIADAKALRDAALAVAEEVRKRFPKEGEQDKLLMSVVGRVDAELGDLTPEALPDPRSPLALFVTGQVAPFVKQDWAAGRIDLQAFYAENGEFLAARTAPLREPDFAAWKQRADEYRFVAAAEQEAFDADVKDADAAIGRIAADIEELVKDEVEQDKIQKFKADREKLTSNLAKPKAAGKLNVKRFRALDPELQSLKAEVVKLAEGVAGEGRTKRTAWLEAKRSEAGRLAGPVRKQWEQWLPVLSTAEGEPLKVKAEQWKRAVSRIVALQAALEEIQRLPAYAPPTGAAGPSWSARLQGVGDSRRTAARDRLLEQVEQAKGVVATDFVASAVGGAAKGLKDEYAAMDGFAKAADGVERLLGEWYGPDDREVRERYAEAKALAARVLAGDEALARQWQEVVARVEPPAGLALDVVAAAANAGTAAQALHHWLLAPPPVIGSDGDADALVRTNAALLAAIDKHAPAPRKQQLSQRVRERCRDAWLAAFIKAADEPAVRRLASRAAALHAERDELKKKEHQRLRYNLWVYDLKQAKKEQVDAVAATMKDFVPDDEDLKRELARVHKILSQKVDAAAVQRVGPMSKPYPAIAWRNDTPPPPDGEAPPQIVLTWGNHQLRFTRVNPQERPGEPETKPFYLCTTEVAAGLFSEVAGKLPAGVPTLGPEHVKIDAAKLGFRHWEFKATTIALLDHWGIDFKSAGEGGEVKVDDYWQQAAGGGRPTANHPMNYVTPDGAERFAAALGCRLPTAVEWHEAFAAERRALADRKPNLRDRSWLEHHERIDKLGIGQLRDTRVGSLDGTRRDIDDVRPLAWRAGLAGGTNAAADAYSDSHAWLAEVDSKDPQAVFHHLIGNVAEYVIDRQTNAFKLVGGSALSMPTDRQHAERLRQDPSARLVIPLDLPVAPAIKAYSDVGFRLAFDSPAATLAEARYVFAKAP